MTALAVFDAALRRAGAGHPTALTLRDNTGSEHSLDPRTWCCDEIPGDSGLLDRCAGPTLDVGCGPGRLAAALTRRGRPALGIDISAAAVRLARRRGAVVLLRNVFDPLPGHGRWRRVLLADGNIGIGGDPHRLLSRSRDLIARDGRVLVEVTAPGTRSWAGRADLRHGTGPDMPMRWASVAVPDLAAPAAAAALRTVETWMEAGRWFASLAPA